MVSFVIILNMYVPLNGSLQNVVMVIRNP